MFNCPANLASHRRWHKPKTSNSQRKSTPTTSNLAPNEILNEEEHITIEKGITDVPNDGFPCTECGKKFRRYNQFLNIFGYFVTNIRTIGWPI